MTRSVLGRALSLALAGGAVFLSACGGGGKPVDPSTPPPTTLPPPPRVLAQGGGPIPAEEGGGVQFNVDVVGRLDITVDWTFATNDIDLILFRGTCTEEQLIADACTVLVIADSASAKPERLTFPNAAVGIYTLVAINFGPEDESASYQIVLTPGAAGPPMASSTRTLRSLRGPVRGLVPLR
jgi:hypothetical protein